MCVVVAGKGPRETILHEDPRGGDRFLFASGPFSTAWNTGNIPVPGCQTNFNFLQTTFRTRISLVNRGPPPQVLPDQVPEDLGEGWKERL